MLIDPSWFTAMVVGKDGPLNVAIRAMWMPFSLYRARKWNCAIGHNSGLNTPQADFFLGLCLFICEDRDLYPKLSFLYFRTLDVHYKKKLMLQIQKSSQLFLYVNYDLLHVGHPRPSGQD